MRGAMEGESLMGMALGTAIGAVTFTGSIIAFAKLQALITGAPLVFPMQHPLNAALGVAIVVGGAWFAATGNPGAFWLLVLLSFALGFLLILPIGGAAMPGCLSMLNSYSGCAAAGIAPTLHNNALFGTGAPAVS